MLDRLKRLLFKVFKLALFLEFDSDKPNKETSDCLAQQSGQVSEPTFSNRVHVGNQNTTNSAIKIKQIKATYQLNK